MGGRQKDGWLWGGSDTSFRSFVFIWSVLLEEARERGAGGVYSEG